jgi:anti-sigma B factor antagonist
MTMELSDVASVEVEHIERPPIALVHVRGELDFGTTPRLVEALHGLPGPGEQLVFDLAGLEFCDSSGLGALIAAHKASAAAGHRLYLANVRPTVLTAITITALDQLFRIRPDLPSVYAEIEDQ